MTNPPTTQQDPLGSEAATERSRAFFRPGDFITLVRGRPLLLGVFLLTVLFALLTAVILRGDLRPTPWDIEITLTVQFLPQPVGAFLEAVSAPGFHPWTLIIITFTAATLAVLRRFAESVFTLLAGAGGALSELVKNLVDRPRPTPDLVNVVAELKSYSFPSGHVTAYTIFLGFLFYLAYTELPARHPLRIPALVVTALGIVFVGPSRIYMGQHWASDAIGGYALGFAYLFLLIEAHRLWLRRRATTEGSPNTPITGG